MEGGGTLSEVYQSARKLLLRARDGIERLEKFESSVSGTDSPELSFAVKKDISQIHSLCADMDRLWRSIPAKSQRDLWKRKVEQVAEEADSLKESLDKYSMRNQRMMLEAKERAELLGRANGESAHVLRIFDEEAQAMQSVRNSSRMLQESFETGTTILSKYAEQRDRLKINKIGDHAEEKLNKLDAELSWYKEQIKKTRPGPAQEAIKARAMSFLKEKRMSRNMSF